MGRSTLGAAGRPPRSSGSHRAEGNGKAISQRFNARQ
jgi:hypothetical protein